MLSFVPALRLPRDLRAELAMIDENLCRAELSPSERAAQTARRKAIYLELHPETGHGKASPNKDDNLSSFAAATAEATGKNERTVQRDAERGEKVCDEAPCRFCLSQPSFFASLTPGWP